MSEEKKEEVLISLDNLEYYQKELVKKIPKEQIWYDNVAPGNGVDENYVFAINYSTGVAYYRTATGAWKMIAGGASTETDEDIKSKVTMVRVSPENIYIPPDEKKCEISCRWMCSVNGKQVNTKGEIRVVVNNNEVETFKEAPGTITVDVREYLKDGSNSIEINIKDGYGTAKKLTFKVEVVQLVLMASGYEQNKVVYEKQFYELGQKGIAVNVTVTGGVKKYLHMIIDGNEYIPETPFPEFDSGRESYTILIPPLTHGSHLVELYAEHTFLNTGKTIYSNSVFYDIIWWDNDDSKSEEDKAFSSAIIASNFQIKSGKQYETFKIPYYLAKSGFETYDVRFTIIRGVKNEETGQYEYPDEGEYVIEQTSPQKKQVGTQLEWVTNSQYAGPICFRIEAMALIEQKKENVEGENGETSDEKVYVYETETIKNFYITLEEQVKPDISRIDRFMPIEFVANQLDNESDKKDVWISYFETAATGGAGGELRAIFKDFDWQSNGWRLRDNRSALKIANGAKLEIPWKIFNWPLDRGSEKDNISFYKEGCGVTIEIDVSFDEVSDAEQDFFTCYYESETENKKRGIRISPTRALLTNGEKTTQVQYSSSESKKYNNSMRFTFVINPMQDRYIPKRTEDEERKYKDTLGSMQIYINGVGAAASDYFDKTFEHDSYPIFGSDGCSVYLHSFRMYRKSLQPDEILRNWIYDMNANDQINAYNDNWIYDSASTEATVDYTKIKDKIPCMIITGTLPTHKGNKRIVDIKFEGTEDGLYDFELEGAQIDVQGTSSQYYPVKNWKFKPKENPNFLIGPEEAGDNREKSEKYALAPDQLPAKVFCLKADYMETSSTHNTVTANIANSIYDEKTPPQKARIAKGQTEATQEEIDRAEKTRTTIYGRPIVVFYRNTPTDKTLRFGGKYNFNYDKDAADVFGFLEEDDKYESYELIDCVEFKDNNNRMCNFLDPFNADLIDDAFEFRHHYHREGDTLPHSYLEVVADWVYHKDCRFATGNELTIPEEERTFETGVAKFLYTNESKIATFKDNNNNTRKVLNLVGIDKPDYKTQAYFETKEYEVTKNKDGTETLREISSSVLEQKSFEATEGEQAWKDLIKTEGEEERTEKKDEKEILIRTIRSYYQSLWWDPNRNEGKGSEVYIFANDTENYRLTLFKNELPEHFNKHYCLMYFLLMELLGMIDSGTKNMFWATWGERHEKHPVLDVSKGVRDYNVIWYPIFYDMDSILGINNVGRMNIPYSVEFDSVFPEGADDQGHCFNGANNAFWNNFKQAFETELNLLFAEKVEDRTFSLYDMLEMYEDHSEHFPVSLYNADGKLKILDKYFEGYYEATPEQIADKKKYPNLTPKYPEWMHVYQGDRYYYRRYWFPNRFNYLLSKNFAGDYASDFISMRLWDPNRGQEEGTPHIHTNYDFEIETWKDQYTTIRYGSRAVSAKCPANQKVTIVSPSDTYNDTETGIYGASNLKSIGKMADKYATTIDLSAAINLLEIDLGSSDPNYNHSGLKSITFGANDMLRRVNIERCAGLSSNLNLASCKNVQEINAKDSSITGVTFNKDGGVVKTLILPNTTSSLVLNNQPKLTTFELPPSGEIINEKGEKINSYNLSTLVVKQTPNVNTKVLVEGSINALEKLEITNIDWRGENKLVDDSLLFRIKEKYENNHLTDTSGDIPYISGICYIDSIRDYLEDELNIFFNGNKVANVSQLSPMNKNDLDSDAPDSVKNSSRRFKLLGTTIKTHLLKFLNKEEGVGDPTKEEDIIDVGLDRHHRDDGEPALIIEKLIPTKAPEWDRTYNFVGWNGKYYSEKDEKWKDIYGEDKVTKKIFNDEELIDTPVENDMVFYPVFKAIPKTFTFTFEPDNGEEQNENKKIKIEDLNDAENVNGKATIVLISGDFVDEFGDKENRTYEHYTARAKAPKIQDNEGAYSTHAWRYTKWKLPGTIKTISEDTEFEILDIQTDIKEQFTLEETQVRKFDYIVQISDKDLDRKYFITFWDYNNIPLLDWNEKIYYKDQKIATPVLERETDNSYSYEFVGWFLYNTPLSSTEQPNRITDKIEDYKKIYFDKGEIVELIEGSDFETMVSENNYKIILKPAYVYKDVQYNIYFHYILGGLSADGDPLSYPEENKVKLTQTLNDPIIGEYTGGMLFNQPYSPDLIPQDTINNLNIKGYHFVGWKDQFGNTIYDEYDFTDIATGETHYYVIAEKDEFDVHFEYYITKKDNKEDVQGTLMIWPERGVKTAYDTKIIPPVSKGDQYETYWKRYTFEKWNQDVETTVQSDKTYEAEYSEEYKYYVHFIDREGEIHTSQYYENARVEVKEAEASYGHEDPTDNYRHNLVEWRAERPDKTPVIIKYSNNAFEDMIVTSDTYGKKEDNVTQNQELFFNLIYSDHRKHYLTFYNSNGNRIAEWEDRPYYDYEIINIPTSEKDKILNTEYDEMRYTYNFNGWTYLDSDEKDGIILIANNVSTILVKDLFKSANINDYTLYLRPRYTYTDRKYTIYFYSINGGNGGMYNDAAVGYYKELTKNDYIWGQQILPPAIPNVEGYTFQGWANEKTTKEYYPQQEITDFGLLDNKEKIGKKYYARWQINTYTVNFKYLPQKEEDNFILWENVNVNGNYQMADNSGQQVKYGFIPDLPSKDYEKPPYSIDRIIKFINWQVTPVTEDITYYAQYDSSEKRKYQITFLDHNGTSIQSQQLEYGAPINKPSEPTREDYLFIGWDKPVDNTVLGNRTYNAEYRKGAIIQAKATNHGAYSDEYEMQYPERAYNGDSKGAYNTYSMESYMGYCQYYGFNFDQLKKAKSPKVKKITIYILTQPYKNNDNILRLKANLITDLNIAQEEESTTNSNYTDLGDGLKGLIEVQNNYITWPYNLIFPDMFPKAIEWMNKDNNIQKVINGKDQNTFGIRLGIGYAYVKDITIELTYYDEEE